MLAAQMADDAPGAGWALPAGPVDGDGHRRTAENWCRRLLELETTAGQLLSVHLSEPGLSASGSVEQSASRYSFEVWAAVHLPDEFTALDGQVRARFFDPAELTELLPPAEREVLDASLCALEWGRVVEWSPQGEVRIPRQSAWKRMMPTLPRPFGPLEAQDPSRGTRRRVSKKR